MSVMQDAIRSRSSVTALHQLSRNLASSMTVARSMSSPLNPRWSSIKRPVYQS